MTSKDLPLIPDFSRQHFNLGELLNRVENPDGQWTDLPIRPGIYLVLWPIGKPLRIREEAGEPGRILAQRWIEITERSPTDILYIGKGDSLRNRVRQLVRFGCGRATNHRGGEDLWWIEGIGDAGVLIQTCPDDKQTGFENEALERFFRGHGNYPLANSQGPRGPERWWPDS